MATPTRKIKASPVKVTGTAPDGQQFESFLEEDFYVLLRFNPSVDRFERPGPLSWTDATGKRRSYTPDVLVHHKPELDGTLVPSVLCEIKPDFSERLSHIPRSEDPAENELKWEAAAVYAGRQGWAWKVYYESEIRTDYLKNAKFLMRYLERSRSEHRKSELLNALSECGPLTLGELISKVSAGRDDEALVRPTCYRLIAHRVIQADLQQILSRSSVLSLESAR